MCRSILTPIKVSHSLLLEIWFSVDQSKSIDGQINAAPPELSVMRTEKSVIVPSVSGRLDHAIDCSPVDHFDPCRPVEDTDLGTDLVRVVCVMGSLLILARSAL